METEARESEGIGGGDDCRHKEDVQQEKGPKMESWEHWHLREKLENQGQRSSREY